MFKIMTNLTFAIESHVCILSTYYIIICKHQFMAKAIRTLTFLSSMVILLAEMKESEKFTNTKKESMKEKKNINPNPKSVV
jgi:hypothetical protein